MSRTINRYRENDRTLTVEVAGHLTTLKTRGTAFRQKQSFKVGPEDSLTSVDIGVSIDHAYLLPMNGITKGLMLTSPHRFKIFHRYLDTDDFALFAVCEGIFTHVGTIMGQLQLVGDYTDPIRCTVVYA